MRTLIIIATIFFISWSCTNDKTASMIQEESEVLVDSIPGQCPYLAKDNQGNHVISWVRMNKDSSAAFCYAVSTDGKSFGNVIAIPGSENIQPHGENLPKIIFKPSGEIIALWGTPNPNPKNKYSGLVYYARSFDAGKTWSDPTPLTADTSSYDQRYYDVALMPDGEAGIIWLDNRKTTAAEGSGLYFAKTNGNNGFTDERLVSERCCQCCRTDLFIGKAGDIHILYRGIIHDSIRDMVHIVSTNKGHSFSTPKRISEDNWVLKGCPHTGPAMTENGEGIHFAWFTGGKKRGCFYNRSTDSGKTFVDQDTVNSKGSHPQITSLDNGQLAIVWDESSAEGGKLNRKIGLQLRDEAGKLLTPRSYLTSPDGDASYPVISASGSTALIAYTQKKGQQNYIVCKTISFN